MTYHVCHGAGAVHFLEISEGSSFTSGQPTVENFTDEATAKARAVELGYVFPEDEE